MEACQETRVARAAYPTSPAVGVSLVGEPTAVYRARRPQTSPLYGLVLAHYESVKGQWEERFQSRYGYWRPFVDEAVARYLDCGILENGFARVRCGACRAEFLVAFSCNGRGPCPSCAAKRAAAFAAYLREQVLEPVDHAQWVLTLWSQMSW